MDLSRRTRGKSGNSEVRYSEFVLKRDKLHPLRYSAAVPPRGFGSSGDSNR